MAYPKRTRRGEARVKRVRGGQREKTIGGGSLESVQRLICFPLTDAAHKKLIGKGESERERERERCGGKERGCADQ
jgi:hypothetical protein